MHRDRNISDLGYLAEPSLRAEVELPFARNGVRIPSRLTLASNIIFFADPTLHQSGRLPNTARVKHLLQNVLHILSVVSIEPALNVSLAPSASCKTK